MLADLRSKIVAKLVADARGFGYTACTVDDILRDEVYAMYAISRLLQALSDSEDARSHIIAVVRGTVRALIDEARANVDRSPDGSAHR
jgi:hypothetical protein